LAEQMKLEEKRRQADLKVQKKKMSKLVKFWSRSLSNLIN
jgi:hypothetical protein